jgi:hypothetical protein
MMQSSGPVSSENDLRAPLRAIAAACTTGTCPTVYISGRQTLVVQGYAVSAEQAGVALPAGELLVEIPVGLLAEALRNLD